MLNGGNAVTAASQVPKNALPRGPDDLGSSMSPCIWLHCSRPTGSLKQVSIALTCKTTGYTFATFVACTKPHKQGRHVPCFLNPGLNLCSHQDTYRPFVRLVVNQSAAIRLACSAVQTCHTDRLHESRAWAELLHSPH